ncbi:MAG TPA: lysophospholipid acyltransferase family protein [Candidatus Angelobacter sp.]|nr:lysophospholipid acyltransferase family protein [Candidatus Angelobacter sp.]
MTNGDKNAVGGESGSHPFSLRQRLLLWLITRAGYLFIRFIGPTLRFQTAVEEGCLSDGMSSPLGIYCFWHRCVIPVAYRFRNRKIAVMTSRSFDGEYIARIINKLGFGAVRGSSSRGAVGALMGMKQELDQGNPVAFTIDGPRGPIYVAKPGPILLSQKTGYGIVCFHIAVERAWILKSWDRMMIPKPFSRVAGWGSTTLHVPAEATEQEIAALHEQMQAMLDRCREQAEAMLKEHAAVSTQQSARKE